MAIAIFIDLFDESPSHFVGIFLTGAEVNEGRVMNVKSHWCCIAHAKDEDGTIE